jgi:hypothetical protein
MPSVFLHKVKDRTKPDFGPCGTELFLQRHLDSRRNIRYFPSGILLTAPNAVSKQRNLMGEINDERYLYKQTTDGHYQHPIAASGRFSAKRRRL